MADAFVFNLMMYREHIHVREQVLRYEYDSRITVERGDVWLREDVEGNITSHQVGSKRTLEGVNGVEYHSFLLPKMTSVERIE